MKSIVRKMDLLNRFLTFALILVLLGAVAPAVPAQNQPDLKAFDDYANKAIKDWGVPGMAVAIVKDDKVILAKGYGVRKLGDPTPVDEKTLFAIGSSSKAFTAAGVAMLVDEKKLNWDDHATDRLPGFQLFDPYVTGEIRIRDLLCHRSGLDRGDFVWLGTPYSRDEILHRVRYLKPSWGFRTHFGYQNIMFLAAGQILARASGESWDDFIKDRIFKPLGMTSSNTSVRDLSGQSDVASPHGVRDGHLIPIPYRNIDNIAPAGSINSNAVDMAQWVRLQLGDGVFNGQRLISKASVDEMHKSQMLIGLEMPWNLMFPDANFLSYGFGWFIHDYRGSVVIEHGGDIDGMAALVSFMPKEKIGVVVLTNREGSELREAMMRKVFDEFLGDSGHDWSAELLASFKKFEQRGDAAEAKLEADRVKGTSPTLSLEKYAGTYHDDFMGEATISVEDGKLVLKAPGFTSPLEHWNYDTFRASFGGRKAFVNFAIDSRGRAAELRIPLLQTTFVAHRGM